MKDRFRNPILKIPQGIAGFFRHCFFATTICLMLAACQSDPPPASSAPVSPEKWTLETNVADLLVYLGEEPAAHQIGAPDADQILTGERLIRDGQLRDPKGGATPLLSHYFRCVDCHNTVREDADLAKISDPQAKLEYAVANKIPLLQGSTFAGMVNRESWYNDDYAKKYRFSLSVRAARSDLRKAIQLCCKECSQGREPEQWEEDAMLAYFWSLQWKLSDLGISDKELAGWKQRALDPAGHDSLITEIKSNYALSSPATFLAMPADTKTGFPIKIEPDIAIGQQVFQRACLHCHNPADGVAETYFRDDEKSRPKLARKFRSSSENSAYSFIRVGTHPETGQRLYMPNYTKERLSDYQIESLRAYLSQK